MMDAVKAWHVSPGDEGTKPESREKAGFEAFRLIAECLGKLPTVAAGFEFGVVVVVAQKPKASRGAADSK